MDFTDTLQCEHVVKVLDDFLFIEYATGGQYHLGATDGPCRLSAVILCTFSMAFVVIFTS